MASATAFNPEVQQVDVYLELVEILFKANKDVVKVLAVIRASNFMLLRNMLAPKKMEMDMFTYHSGVTKSQRSYPSWRGSRSTNNSRRHGICDRVFHRLAMHCEFREHLQKVLGDRLVYSLRRKTLRRQQQQCAISHRTRLSCQLRAWICQERTPRLCKVTFHQSTSLANKQEVSGATRTALSQNMHTVTPTNRGKPDQCSCYQCGMAEHKAVRTSQCKCMWQDRQSAAADKLKGPDSIAACACGTYRKRGQSISSPYVMLPGQSGDIWGVINHICNT